MLATRVILLGASALAACTGVGGDALVGLPPWAQPVPEAGSITIAGRTLARAVRDERSGIVFVLVRPGTFIMGTDVDALPDEQPAHEVHITRPFYLGRTEVTLGQWQRFVDQTGWVTGAGENGGLAYTLTISGGRAIGMPDPRATWKDPIPHERLALTDDHPVTQVSWEEAESFCKHFGYRLPTEAEWEYACRAGTRTRFWWGDAPEQGRGKGNFWDASLAARLPSANAFPFDDGQAFLAPVASYAPNPFGLYDMLGNVWEWCEDWYDEKYYEQEDATRPDPVNRSSGKERVIRGGGWASPPRVCGSGHRSKDEPGYRNDRSGLRVAWSP